MVEGRARKVVSYRDTVLQGDAANELPEWNLLEEIEVEEGNIVIGNGRKGQVMELLESFKNIL